MTTLRLAIPVVLCSLANPWMASAADVFLEGESSCLSIGGAWSGSTCAIDRLVVPADARLFTGERVTLSTTDLVIDGVLEVYGGLETTRTVINRGTFITRSSFISSRAQILNQGEWLNEGGFAADNTVVNEWSFDNDGWFVVGGAFINRGVMAIYNGGTVENAGGLLTNEGVIYNYAYLYNTGVLDNAGLLVTYDAVTFNYGRAIGRCGSEYAVEFPGFFIGSPVELDPCTGTDAVGILANYVLGMGQRRVLSKDDTIVLSGLLYRAHKRLQMGRASEGVALLQTCISEVLNRLPYPIRSVLYWRARRALDLVAGP